MPPLGLEFGDHFKFYGDIGGLDLNSGKKNAAETFQKTNQSSQKPHRKETQIQQTV